MRLGAERAERHRRTDEPFDDLGPRLDFVQWHWAARGQNLEQIAQRRRPLFRCCQPVVFGPGFGLTIGHGSRRKRTRP